ncbi:MAG: [FeFe] hydrogenase H-cluster maturation GTPase HydF [Sphaerochaetaceae bacterium]|nr:[FeFe] hydrogenase H-cluster maturation GTPase HydF [Candidatus Cloacimonadota bacterium]
MEINDKISAERVHIAFFGMRNAGKSSVVNAVTSQDLSLVSDVKGTTTDPVRKTMELLPIGPVVIIDTPGIDDEGELGQMRVKRALKVLNQADIAILVVDAVSGLQPDDQMLIDLFRKKEIRYIIAYNKADLLPSVPNTDGNTIYVSAKTKANINELRNLIGTLFSEAENTRQIVADLVSENDLVVLVVPIDSSAPKGRLILPQQQVIRELLECGAIAVVSREKELAKTLESLGKKPRMVITDSQAFGVVSKIVPDDIPLTSFSILFARYKGDLKTEVQGAAMLDRLEDGDTVLISEGCTHHRQCQDIGTVKLPTWIQNYTKKSLQFEYSSGTEFPDDLSKYAMVVHCGACMLSEREMKSRIRHALDEGKPITNYGVAIAHIHGILKRSLQLFPDIAAELK